VKQDPLDVHCEIDDGFALCGGNYVPRVPHDQFVYLGEVLANATRPPRRWPWQRCPSCVSMLESGQ
jgi:hypothetical protein